MKMEKRLRCYFGHHKCASTWFASIIRAVCLDIGWRDLAYKKGLDLFVRHSGERPLGFRSAAWDLTPHTIELIQQLGFRYDSSLMADDRPYRLVSRGHPTPLVELPVEWILDDWPYFQLDWDSGHVGLRDPAEVYAIWREEFDVARDEGGLFLLTLHPQVIGHRHRIRMLERLIVYIKSRPGVWFATHAAIAAHVAPAGFTDARPASPDSGDTGPVCGWDG